MHYTMEHHISEQKLLLCLNGLSGQSYIALHNILREKKIKSYKAFYEIYHHSLNY